MVHVSMDRKKAVIAILYKIGPPDQFLEEIEDYIKRSETKELQDLGVINPNNVVTLGSKDPYYRYIGSLTTPPCSEGVTWTIINKVGTVTDDQVKLFPDVQEEGSQENARPLQPTNARVIKLFSNLLN
ncbi:putative carbonic anhydrase [Dioscorea sansibarensis]